MRTLGNEMRPGEAANTGHLQSKCACHEEKFNATFRVDYLRFVTFSSQDNNVFLNQDTSLRDFHRIRTISRPTRPRKRDNYIPQVIVAKEFDRKTDCQKWTKYLKVDFQI